MSELTAINNSIISVGNSLVQVVPSTPVDPYNPLGLPTFTIRARFAQGTTPSAWSGTSWDSLTLVDSEQNIWDITRNDSDWSFLLRGTSLREILGANSTGVTSMYYMCSFYSGALEKTALFDTSTVTRMTAMFDGAKITSVPLFDTSSCTSMVEMFRECYNLVDIPLFDTRNVTTFYGMFLNCGLNGGGLTTVPLFNTSSATTLESMFSDCQNLSYIPQFDITNVTNMWSTFRGCYKVESGALQMYQRASSKEIPVTNHRNTFYECGRDTVTGAAELAQIPDDWKYWSPV